MKAFKFLPVAAVVACSLFNSVNANQVCPVGGGACTNRPVPASSNSNARAVDNFIRPVIPSAGEIARDVFMMLPPPAPSNTVVPTFVSGVPSYLVGQSSGLYDVSGLCISGFGGGPLDGNCRPGSGFFVTGISGGGGSGGSDQY
jgi:hypothetical protein